MELSDDWQSKSRRATDRLKAIRDREHQCDTTFEIEYKGHVSFFKAHKLILSMSSSVFDAMFYGPLAESDKIRITDATPKAFEAMLNYIYSGDETLPDMITCIETAYLAKKYLLQHLSEICESYVRQNLSPSNACTVFEASLSPGSGICCPFLSQEALRQITDNINEVMTLGDFDQLQEDRVREVLEYNNLELDPALTFKALLRWSQLTCTSTEEEINPQNLKKVILPFLPFVNFLMMSADEIFRFVCSSEILTGKETAAIGLKEPTSALPPWCSRISGFSVHNVQCQLLPQHFDRFKATKIYECTFSTPETYSGLTGFSIPVWKSPDRKTVLFTDTHVALVLKRCSLSCTMESNGSTDDLEIAQEKIKLPLKRFMPHVMMNPFTLSSEDFTFKRPIKITPGVKYTFRCVWGQGEETMELFSDHRLHMHHQLDEALCSPWETMYPIYPRFETSGLWDDTPPVSDFKSTHSEQFSGEGPAYDSQYYFSIYNNVGEILEASSDKSLKLEVSATNHSPFKSLSLVVRRPQYISDTCAKE